MTHRERLLATLRFQPVDRVPDYEFGAWVQTVDRWHREGLPEKFDGVWTAISEYFDTDDYSRGSGLEGLNLRLSLYPAFEEKVLEVKGDHIIKQDNTALLGAAYYGARILKQGKA